MRDEGGKAIAPGCRVWLRGCVSAGSPGEVMRAERGRLVVYWHDLDFWSRHKPEALIVVEEPGKEQHQHG